MNPLTALEAIPADAYKGEWLNWTKMADFESTSPTVIVGGEGPYAIDKDGNRLLDGVSGLFTTQIGYSHGAEIGEAARQQLETLSFYPNWAATHPSALALTERLLGLAPEKVVIDIGDKGNTTAASIPIAMTGIYEAGGFEPGQLVILVGFGAGAAWSCQAVRVRG